MVAFRVSSGVKVPNSIDDTGMLLKKHDRAPVLFFLADSGPIPLFYPKIGHKYLNL
jgi:hypothetical protein